MRGSKDAALAVALRRLLNTRLGAFGDTRAVSLDTARRRAQVRLGLHGETAPVDLDIRRYEVGRADDGDWLMVVDAVASREWLTVALRRFVVGRRFPLSPKAAVVLRLLT